MFYGSKIKKEARRIMWHCYAQCVTVVAAVAAMVGLACYGSQRVSACSSAFNLLSLCVFSVVGGTAAIATSAFFLQIIKSQSGESTTFADFLAGCEHWLAGFWAAMILTIKTAIGLVFFIVPGIVALLKYSQVFFILAEHPQMSVRHAFKISEVMTKGYKGDLFGLAMSFLPHFIIAEIFYTFSIKLLLIALVVFASAEIAMTFSNAYIFLKRRSLSDGRLLPEDFED